MSGRIACRVAYDGTDFNGWQVQPGARTVQDEVEKAFERLCGGIRPRIHGSGRTDTGVHARGQVFHVDPARQGFTGEKWLQSLNGVLPEDIRVMKVSEVSDQFHARFNAVEKEYRYAIHNAPVCPPDLRRVRVHVRSALDIDAMRDAAGRLVGEHDFRSFSASRGEPEASTIRTLLALDVRTDGETVWVLARANGFLYKMVRQLSGALLRVGRGELTPEEVEQMLHRPERDHLAPTAPAKALFLWNVTYPEPV